MIRLSFKQAAQILKTSPPEIDGDFAGISIDPIKTLPGQVFVAIVRGSFDGHLLAREAAFRGAVAMIVERSLASCPLPQIQVGDTRAALASLAGYWRHLVRPRVIGITGSVGKTTTKEFCRSVFEIAGSTFYSQGNQNNDFGLPLTLLSMPPDTRYVVLEMGMRAPGEIEYLARVAEPEIGVVTNVGPAHLGRLGSLEAIARAKGELLQAVVAKDGCAIVPDDEPFLRKLARRADRHVLFGVSQRADIRVVEVSTSVLGTVVRLSLPRGDVVVRTRLVGRYQAFNIAATFAVGLDAGMSARQIEQGIRETPMPRQRCHPVRIGRMVYLDDSYNSNPLSALGALRTLKEVARGRPTAAVLGAMAELGSESGRLHRDLGAQVQSLGVELLIVVGGQRAEAIAEGALRAGMSPQAVLRASNPEEASAVLLSHFVAGIVLVKASRDAGLERVIQRACSGERGHLRTSG